LSSDFQPDMQHHLERHRLVTFVVQAACGAPLGVVADRAFEGHHRAFGPGQNARDDGACVDRSAGEGKIVAVLRDFGDQAATAAHGRQKRDLVAFSDT